MLVKTTDSNKVWQAPDGQKSIWEVTLKGENDTSYLLKTYSPRIATLGFEGEVESYVNARGDRFVRQTIKAKQPADTARETSIRAQWAIGQAINLASATMEKQKITLPVIEKYAKDLFVTVSRVKGEKLSSDEVEQAAHFISRHAQAQSA